MESALTWEYNTLIDELTQGMEKAKQLGFHLNSTPRSQAQDLLLRGILASYEKALLILKWNGPVVQAEPVAPTSGAPESSITIDESPKSVEVNKNFTDDQEPRQTPKKRKQQPTWTEQVRIVPENGYEGPTDGYSWRKYGQKDILGAKYPRSYYRCTYRHVQNCWAIKQVQRSDDDPTVFDITYKGTHTCSQSNNEVPPLVSPEKQDMTCNYPYKDQAQPSQTLLNLKTNLKVDTEDLDNKEKPAHNSLPSTVACHDRENYYFPSSGLVDDNSLGTNSSLFYSPDTSESNYFSAATHQMYYGKAPNMLYPGSDIADITSVHTSVTSSPVGHMEFSIDSGDLDPYFLLNIPGIFT